MGRILSSRERARPHLRLVLAKAATPLSATFQWAAAKEKCQAADAPAITPREPL
jgi:hypothetical protein